MFGPDKVEGRRCGSGTGAPWRRIALFELLVLDDTIRNLIVGNASLSKLRRLAKSKGMDALREDGLQEVHDGVTTIGEVLRVTEA